MHHGAPMHPRRSLAAAAVLFFFFAGCSSGGSAPAGAGGPDAGGPDAGGAGGGSDAGGSEADVFPFERSGARLEARGIAADGVFVFDAFFDTKLGFPCVRGDGNDLSQRCVPRDLVELPATTGDYGPTAS